MEALRSLAANREVAVALGRLATVRMLQGRHAEALRGHRAARATFMALGEPRAVAAAWFQEGRVFEEARQLPAAENAYQQALAIEQTRGDQASVAATMTQLAQIADQSGRLEEAVAWEHRAIELKVMLGDPKREANSRRNLGDRLYRMGRLAEAEVEVHRAIAIADGIGVSAQPWDPWDILHDIHRDRGDAASAAQARERAQYWYRRYRTEGGYPRALGADFFAATAEALNGSIHARGTLMVTYVQLAADPRVTAKPRARALFIALIAVLKGDHISARAALPELDPINAVELERLLAGTWP